MSTVVEIILRGVDQVMPAVKNIRSSVGSLAKDLEKDFEAAGQAMQNVGGALTKLTAPLTLAGGAATAMAMNLNSAMGDVETLIPGATDRIVELKQEVQDLAIAVGKNTGDVANGLYQVISAFGDSADSMDVLGISARAATAGVAQTTDAINLLSAVTKGYGDTSVEAVQKASDLAFTTVKLGQTTFPELASSIGSVVPLAAGLNVESEELFATFATLTGVTGSASEVATQFRGVLQGLMAPTGAMSDLISSLGFSSGQAMLEQLGLQGTIQAIAQAATQTGQPLQNYISSIEGQTAILALAGGQAQAFTEKLAAMGQAAGATDEAFAAKTQGINAAGFAWQQLQVKLQVTAQHLGDSLAPAFTTALAAAQPLISAVQAGVQWFASLDEEQQKTIVTIAAVVAAAGPMLIVLGQVVSAIGTLIPVVQGLGTALTFLTTNPIGMVITAIGLLVAAGIWLYTHWDEVRALAIQIWTSVSEFFTGLFTGIAEFFTNIWTSITTGIQTAWTAIVDWFREWWGTILLAVFTGGIGLIVALLIANWDTIRDGVVQAWTAIQDFFATTWQALKDLATAGMAAIVEWVADRLQAAYQNWMDVWQAVTAFFRDFWPNVKRLAIEGMTALALWLADKGAEIYQGIVDMWNGIIDFLLGLPGRMVDAGANIIKGLVRGIGSVKIPVPQVSISTEEGPFGLKVPKLNLGVDWRSIADMVPWLAKGGIVNGATLAGIGEAGPEAVLPLDRIVPLMSEAIAHAGGAGGGGDMIRIDMRGSTFLDGRDAGRRLVGELTRRGYRLGGG